MTKTRQPADKRVRPRWGWLRVFYQFSLRTLLIVVTLAAVACWWLLRPETLEEELAGKHLTLRRQVRIEPVPDDSNAPPSAERQGTAVNSGSWQLRNEHREVLVAGRYARDVAQGHWVAWHANGQKAVEGHASGGLRTGIWRTWDEQGQLGSEVSYRTVIQPGLESFRGNGARPIRPTTFLPVVGLFVPPGRIGNPMATAGPSIVPSRLVSQRHGPARTWYASGQQHYEGGYAEDRRSGQWTWFDEQGNVAERGNYQADRREGPWQIGGGLLYYVAGSNQAEHSTLLVRLEQDLNSGDIGRIVAAIGRLEALGPRGVPLLLKQLDIGDDEAKLLALRSLLRLDALPADMLPKIEPLAVHADSRLALRAMLAVYADRPAAREELFARIMKRIDECDSQPVQLEVLKKLCELDSQRQPAVFLRLMEVLAHDAWEAHENGEWRHGDADEFLLDLKADLLPLLEQSIAWHDSVVRWYTLRVVARIVESGEGARPLIGGAGAQMSWPIPPALAPLINRAKTDPDPAVRELAAQIGQYPVSRGMGGGVF